jgi:antitoxin HicB
MPYYIALIHKEDDSSYGVSFPDWPGVITAGDTIDDAVQKASEVLQFAAEDWATHTGSRVPAPSTIDDLRKGAEFREMAKDAIVVAVPFRLKVEAAE